MMNELHAAKYRRDAERDTLPRYSAPAIEAAIASSNWHGPKISKREARAIHALLRGGSEP